MGSDHSDTLDECKYAVQRVFELWSIIGINDRMYVEFERHGCISEFFDSVHWVEPASHPNLVDVFAERANVRNDVYVSRTRLLGTGESALVVCVGFREFHFKLGDLRQELLLLLAVRFCRVVLCLAERISITILFLFGVLTRFLDFALRLLFFAHLLADPPLLFFFSLDLFFVFVGEVQFVEL